MAAAVWVFQDGWAWWKSKRIGTSECWYGVHDPRGERMCVVLEDLGPSLTADQWLRVAQERPPIFCGDAVRASEFVRNAGHKICNHTTFMAPP